MRKKWITIFICSFIIAACAKDDREQTDVARDKANTQPIHYETKKEQNERTGYKKPSIGEKGGYPQSKQEGLNEGHTNGNYTDPFSNDEAMNISNVLSEREDIRQAQVAVTDDRVIVSVMLKDHIDHNITKSIEKEVQKITPEKNIIIYTDDKHWDRMRNLNARLKQSNIGQNIEDAIDNLLNGNE